MVYVNNSDVLCHYGVKGMKWGHRKDPTRYGGTITSNGKYKASNGVVVAKSRNAGVAASRRFSTSLAGRGLAAVGSIGMNEKQKTALKKQQAALREYQKAGGDKMLKNHAKAEAKAAKKEYHQTDEYKAKRARAIKVGAAVAGTALAAYGAYKVSKILKDKASTKSYEAGKAAMDHWMASIKQASRTGDNDRWAISAQMYRETARRADERTKKVGSSTIEAAKYLWKNR